MTVTPSTPGPDVVLLTRAGCAACATALTVLTAVLADYGLAPQVRDVDLLAEEGDRITRAEYGDRLPVVLLDGAEHSYWEVDEARLRADLDARR
ncbi:glutaredoxin family protein [Gordonia sp. VNK21]|uniref:glutaredoxin family protein n=1 Tax=Gordonia sp. VNK21 TaxID=3382483 RepID=UPI0038D489A7